MGYELREILADGGTRKVQKRNVVTLPKEWRDQHGVEPGDQVGFRIAEDGTLEVIAPGA